VLSIRLTELYKMLGLSKQAHHQHRIQHIQQACDIERILQEVVILRINHPVMGLKKLYHKLKYKPFGRDKFIELGLEAGLSVPRPKNYQRTTFSTKSNRYQNLLVGVEIDDIDQLWVSDITYFWVNNRFYYITLIMDVYSRKIVGYCAAPTLEATANVEALSMALKMRKKITFENLIHHSDKGTQYVYKEYVELLQSRKIRISMCNIVYENTHSERLNGIIKNEYLRHRSINSLADLKRHLAKDVELYNQDRPHDNLNKMSPNEFENHLLNVPKNQRIKMNIYVDERTISKQKFGQQLGLF
jgi:putative transposase